MSANSLAFWTSWRLDAGLLLLLMLLACIYLRGWQRLRRRGAVRFGPWRLAAFGGGLATVWFALQSPLEPFSSLLLQMHMIQHVLLMFVAPPLLWLADPELPLLVGLPKFLRRLVAVPLLREPVVRGIGHMLAHPAVAWILFVVAAWAWHLPAFYELALSSEFWHQIEHASFFGAALVFWRVVIAPYPSRASLERWVVLPYLLLAGLQGTALCALLTFSDRVFYPHYNAVPRLWNISALDDQAIAGAMMWALGSLAYLLALTLVTVELWQKSDQPQWAGASVHKTRPRPVRARPPSRRRAEQRVTQLRQLERTQTPPVREPWDALRLPMLGPLLKKLAFRRTLQVLLFVLAAWIVIDGLLGPQATAINLAGVTPWIHWRGVLVIGLLVAGNLFCMACPFTLPRTLAKKILPGNWNWPLPLRNKWLAVGLLVLFFWAYEAFALWDSPWWTAWIVIGYFVASFAVDGLFRGAAFCKYVCPIGQFNFFQSLVSPLQVTARNPSVCHTCQTKDCLRGGPQGNGCTMDLFIPNKASNLDCTFCLDCVRACPEDNVGLLAFVPSNQLSQAAAGPVTARPGGTGWWRRTDVAALLLVLSSAAFVNAAWMVEPVVRLEEKWIAVLQFSNRPLFIALGMVLALLVIPVVLMLAVAALSRLLSQTRTDLRNIAVHYTIALVPLAVAMWAAHYAFHLFTSAGTIVAAGNRFLADWHLATLSPAAVACACCGEAASWILPVEIVCLDVGLCLALLIAYRVARSDGSSRRTALLAWAPWAVLLVTLFAVGLWIFLQPMQMRGTLELGV
jgi:cytochrome c oxidase assembly factor CtaG